MIVTVSIHDATVTAYNNIAMMANHSEYIQAINCTATYISFVFYMITGV